MPMTRTVALITGANKGIGLETARQLARKGLLVIIGARDEAKGRAAAESIQKEGFEARAVRIDVTDPATIAEAARRIEGDPGRLDVLVNNAGVFAAGKDGPASTTGVETFRQTFDANLFGLVAVTQAFLPLLRKSSAGRIVNLSSILGSVAEHGDPNSGIYQMKVAAYDCSKAAVNMYTNHLAHELRGTAIKVNAAHPGWVKTDMGGPEAPMDVVDGAKTSVWLATLPPDGPSGGFYHTQVHMRW
ncbi:MAG: SDR family oxidoreductase [Phycisphaerales bacterium]|nr:SDR family oxidoreductase [Phycisphaerales bacterium]